MTTRQIARAMAEQVERVNTDPVRLLEIIGELRQTIVKKDRAIEILQQQLEFVSDGEQLQQSGYYEYGKSEKKRYLDGKRVFTLQEAAKKGGVSYWIAQKYMDQGWWKGEKKPGSNEWLVYATNSFVRRPRKKPQRRSKS